MEIEHCFCKHWYGKYRKTPLWKETDPTYFTGKTDPGESFLKKVREGIKNLNKNNTTIRDGLIKALTNTKENTDSKKYDRKYN